MDKFHFRWLNIKGFDTTFPISKTLFFNHLNWNWSQLLSDWLEYSKRQFDWLWGPCSQFRNYLQSIASFQISPHNIETETNSRVSVSTSSTSVLEWSRILSITSAAFFRCFSRPPEQFFWAKISENRIPCACCSPIEQKIAENFYQP